MKTVVIQTSYKLPCSCEETPTVQFCVTEDSLLSPYECPEDSPAETPYPLTTLEGTIKKGWSNTSECGNTLYSYAVEYDEAQLAEPETGLLSSQVAGIFCHNCLTTWVRELVGNEPTLEQTGARTWLYTSPHGCETEISIAAGDVCIADTETIDLSIDEAGCIEGAVKISADAGNTITAHADGIYSPTPEPYEPCVQPDTETLELNIDEGGCIGGNVKVSDDADNILETRADGLYAAIPCLATNEDISLEINDENCLEAHLVYNTDLWNGANNDDGLFVLGSTFLPRRAISNSQDIVSVDGVIFVSAASGNVNLTLPAPNAMYVNTNISKFLIIRRTDSSGNIVEISGPINGVMLPSTIIDPGGSLFLVGDGTIWRTIS